MTGLTSPLGTGLVAHESVAGLRIPGGLRVPGGRGLSPCRSEVACKVETAPVLRQGAGRGETLPVLQVERYFYSDWG